MIRFQVLEPENLDQIADLEVELDQKIRMLLEAIAIETIAYLRSLTTEMRPPAKPGEPSRFAHPGGWADVTGQLANSYGWAVRKAGIAWELELRNDAGHAIYLEEREGYFVLRGVTEPGGPVEQALRAVIARIAPDWEVDDGQAPETPA